MQSNIRSFAVAAGAAALVTLGMSSVARAADEASKFTYSFNIGAASDYMFRGFSQTDDEPAIQGGADIGYGIAYAGIWASNVEKDFQNGASTEIDLYFGVKPVWDKVNFDFGFLYYAYPNQINNGIDADYIELKASASTEIVKSLTGTVLYYFSPDYAFNTGDSHTIEGNLAYVLPAMGVFTPTISGTIGYQTVEEDISFETDGTFFNDIVYWNAGLALAVEKITFDFRYYGADKDVDIPGQTSTDDRFVFGVKLVLP